MNWKLEIRNEIDKWTRPLLEARKIELSSFELEQKLYELAYHTVLTPEMTIQQAFELVGPGLLVLEALAAVFPNKTIGEAFSTFQDDPDCEGEFYKKLELFVMEQ